MDASVTENNKLDVFFLPFLAPGHMIPLVDMARVFARRGVNVTFITTPFNALLFQNSIDLDIKAGYPFSLHLLKFPAAEVGLPEGIENFNTVKTREFSQKLYIALRLLRPQIEQFIIENHPDCIITDMFFPWTNDLAAQLGIPRIYFNPTGFFPQCSIHCLESITSDKTSYDSYPDTEPFLLPGFPDEIKTTKLQIPDHLKSENPYGGLMKGIRASIPGSFGCVGNSYYEFEPAYIDHFKKVVNSRVWALGPVSLCNRDPSDKAQRSGTSELSCLSWLDSKKPNSVLYISFGSMTGFGKAQLHEIALGLEASGHPFIWVIRKPDGYEDDSWLPDGFEKKMRESDKGLIITSWAPQLLILEHPSVGGFMMQAGWNSILESVCAGVPMITWPFYAEQIHSDRLLTQVLKIAVPVGVKNETWSEIIQDIEEDKVTVTRENVESSVKRLMDGGDEAIQIRERVKELGEKAHKAVEEGGSSYNNMTDLIQQIRLFGKT